MTVTENAQRCAICGSKGRIEHHHIAKAENVRSATLPTCVPDHARLDVELYRLGVRPGPGPGSRKPAPSPEAQVAWALVCGVIAAVRSCTLTVTQQDRSEESEQLLGDVARLLTALDGQDSWLGVSPVDDLLRKGRARDRRLRRQRRSPPSEITGEALERFVGSLLTALADAIEELLGEHDPEFVDLLHAMAAGAELFVGSVLELESHPRVAEFERVRVKDRELIEELPRATLRLIRAEIAGESPNPTDRAVLETFKRREPVWLDLLQGQATANTEPKRRRVIDRYLDGGRT
jgi:hypothetical protein